MTKLTGLRQSGRTTRQLEALSHKATFIVATGPMIGYVRDLCVKIHRQDIKVVSFQGLRPENYRGLRVSEIQFDHTVRDYVPYVRIYPVVAYLQLNTRAHINWPPVVPETSKGVEPKLKSYRLVQWYKRRKAEREFEESQWDDEDSV